MLADLMQVEAVACHIHEVRRDRCDYTQPFHARDLIGCSFYYMDHHPALILDRNLPVDLFVSTQNAL